MIFFVGGGDFQYLYATPYHNMSIFANPKTSPDTTFVQNLTKTQKLARNGACYRIYVI